MVMSDHQFKRTKINQSSQLHEIFWNDVVSIDYYLVTFHNHALDIDFISNCMSLLWIGFTIVKLHSWRKLWAHIGRGLRKLLWIGKLIFFLYVVDGIWVFLSYSWWLFLKVEIQPSSWIPPWLLWFSSSLLSYIFHRIDVHGNFGLQMLVL